MALTKTKLKITKSQLRKLIREELTAGEEAVKNYLEDELEALRHK